MVYPIYILGSHVLREEAVEIERDFPNLEQLVSDMFETMYASDGVGLAAPQIGKSLRMFVVDTAPMEELDDEGVKAIKQVFINPEIYEESDTEVLMNEGCLSVPGIHEDIYRPETIRIRWVDEHFVEHDEQFTGWPARAVQHEYDHIDGIVFTDHLSALRKTLLRSKLNQMTKGKYSVHYKAKQVK